MQMHKGIKILRNKKGKPRKLVIDINKHYSFVETLLDVLDSEKRLKESGRPAEEVYRVIEAGFKKGKKS
jgi:hypothetical protein